MANHKQKMFLQANLFLDYKEGLWTNGKDKLE